MRIPIPSFRVQIILLVLFLVINSVLFFRNYFLDSFQEYSNTIETMNVKDKINRLYQDYSSDMVAEDRLRFKKDVENILATDSHQAIARNLFENELSLYSKFIFVFLTLAVLIFFFISFNLITRPLNRLQAATEELSKGNWKVNVRESPFSPLNDLISSFNSMIRELEINRNKLVQAEKESAWRDMARIMAHEIKNPLTPITLSLERLEYKYKSRSGDFDKVLQSVTSIIHEEIDNLKSLAGEFSRFARLPKAHLAFYDLNAQLRELVKPYDDQAYIELDLEPNLLPIRADRLQMKQVFVNLIQNGIQSSKKPCRIRIKTATINSTLSINIEDNGVGIDEKDLKKIFDPYFTRREKGTGLGLAIVKRIVEQHQGVISVKSEIGKGTVFTLLFPITTES